MGKFLSFVVLSIGLFTLGFVYSAAEGMATNNQKHPMAPEYFAIASATLDGQNYNEIVKDPIRQISHARVSDDHKWVVFSRFNRVSRYGVALEEEGYDQTSIVRTRIDGSELETMVPHKEQIANFNAYWTPDNQEITYISTDKPGGQARIYLMDLASRRKSRLATPEGIIASDPQMKRDVVVYPGMKSGDKFAIHIMNRDGTDDRRLSSPPPKKSYGEYDPKISPDLSKVVFTRYVTKDEQKGPVHVIVVDIKTGAETDLTALSQPDENNNLDSFPEWSSDGKLLVFWHINRKDLRKSGLYTIRPDGSERRRIALPLPNEYTYSFPSFWPGTGSGKDAKIIFSVRRLPEKIRKKLEEFGK